MSFSPRQRSNEKVEGKPVQEDVGGRVPDITQSEPPKMSEKVEDKPVGYCMYPHEVGKSVGWPFPDDPSKVKHYGPNRIDPVSGRKICACGRYCVDFNSAGYSESFLLNPKQRFLTAIPGMFVPSYNWPFVDEMAAKSDDKTLVVSHITREIGDEADFRKLFEPFGEVKSVTLAPINQKGTHRGRFGFVTFVNKEDAQQAMDTLNFSGPRGWDKRTLKLDWASSLKKPN